MQIIHELFCILYLPINPFSSKMLQTLISAAHLCASPTGSEHSSSLIIPKEGVLCLERDNAQ